MSSGGVKNADRRFRFARDIQNFLQSSPKRVRTVLMVPYAHPPFDEYIQFYQRLFPNYQLVNINTLSDKLTAVKKADALFMPGGNTYLFKQRMVEMGIFDEIKAQVLKGKPYIGVSAGTDMTWRSIFNTPDWKLMFDKNLSNMNLDGFGFFPTHMRVHYMGRNEEFAKVSKTEIKPGDEVEVLTDGSFLKSLGIPKYREFSEMIDTFGGKLVALYEGDSIKIQKGKMSLPKGSRVEVIEKDAKGGPLKFTAFDSEDITKAVMKPSKIKDTL